MRRSTAVLPCPVVIGERRAEVETPARAVLAVRLDRARAVLSIGISDLGGIETADDAWERIVSGATLLQGYTGFIYGGGLWAKHIHDGIAQRLRDGGFSSLTEAVGSARKS